MNLRRVLAVASKEIREVLRDRIYCALAFLLPAMLMVVFGYGMTHDVEHVPLAVVDFDQSAASREYVQHFIGSRYFAYQGALPNEREAVRALNGGRLRVVLIVPEKFQERLTAGRPADVQMLLDGTFTISVRTIQGYLEAINAAASSEVTIAALAWKRGLTPERALGLIQPARLEIRYLYNQEARSIWGIAPLLIMFILTWITPLLLGLSVVRERETGSIYNIYASTVTRAEYLAGKLLPNVLICSLNAVVLWLLATQYFRAPFRGSLALFALGTLLFIITASGLGLLAATFARNAAQVGMLVLLIVMPLAILSGTWTPMESLPPVLRDVMYLSPLRHFIQIVYGILLRGAGLDTLWDSALAMALLGSALFALGAWRFRRQFQ